MPTGFTPIYKITRNNIDITGHFSDRCVSLRVDFSAGDGQEDSCVIVLDDRDWAIARPNEGETISIFLGYKEVGMAFMGSYELEEVHFTYPPKAIMLKGTSSGAETFLKSQISQLFENQTLGDIFAAMAKKGGISAEVHPSLRDVKIKSVNALGSPYDIIHRLEREHNAVAKIANGKLQVVPRDKGEDVYGNQKPVIILNQAHFGEIDVKHATKGAFSRVRAAYIDPQDYTTKFVEAVSTFADAGNFPPFVPHRKFNSKQEAQAAADAQMQSLQRSLGEATMVLAKGDPWIHDQQRILIRGMRDGINGSYVSDLVSHTYVKDQGIATQIHAKAPSDAGDYESLFDQASEADQKRLFLDPGPAGVIGTVIDRFVTGLTATAQEVIDGLSPF